MEEWKDIQGYEGRYRVSNTGKVLSLHYMGGNKVKELTPKKSNKGYLWVELAKDRKTKTFLIHRLVAEAFIENPNKYPIINHKDENPLNNDMSNLEWCTYSYNNQYSRDRHPERRPNKASKPKIRRKTDYPYQRICQKPYKLFNAVIQMDFDGNVIRKYENIKIIVKEKGFNGTSIKECCEHKRHKAYGYKWEYAT